MAAPDETINLASCPPPPPRSPPLASPPPTDQNCSSPATALRVTRPQGSQPGSGAEGLRAFCPHFAAGKAEAQKGPKSLPSWEESGSWVKYVFGNY